MERNKARELYEKTLENKQYKKLLRLFIKHYFFLLLHTIAKFIGRYTGLSKLGYANTLKLKVNQFNLFFPALPKSFNGYKILFFSDFHFDSNPTIANKLSILISDLEYDLVLSAGDFKAAHMPYYQELKQLFDTGFSTLKETQRFAVAGNHDNAKVASILEGTFEFLYNRSVKIIKDNEHIQLIGIDDCHFFQADDIDLAFKEVNKDEFSILLSHSPEIYQDAEKLGTDLTLSGHTHGGQICLPGGIPIMGNVKKNRSIIKQHWKYRKMKGFTTNGVGTSLLPIRFNCPPEVCLITLRRGYGA